MKPITPLELECITAACQYCTDKAREHELDDIRHEHFAASPAATTGVGPRQTPAELKAKNSKPAEKCPHLAEAARQMGETAHQHNFASLLAEAERIAKAQTPAPRADAAGGRSDATPSARPRVCNSP